MPLLNISVQGASTSYRADGSINTGETDAVRLFNTLFASRALPPDQLAALKARRGSVLDYLTTELGSYGTRLGTDDRAKVATHLESIRQLEMSLAVAPADATCVATAPNEPGLPTDYRSSTRRPSRITDRDGAPAATSRAVGLTW